MKMIRKILAINSGQGGAYSRSEMASNDLDSSGAKSLVRLTRVLTTPNFFFDTEVHDLYIFFFFFNI